MRSPIDVYCFGGGALYFRVVDRSACSNAPNIFSICFSVSPMPVSTIEINTWINVYADGNANMLRKLDCVSNQIHQDLS